MNSSRLICLAIAMIALAACGGDSTGTGTVDADDALRSLRLGFSPGSGVALPFGLSPSALASPSGLDQINVTIGGTPHTMYALGLRVTYPTGTCFETIFVSPSTPPGQCTPPPLGLVLVLWQTRSGSRTPDRMIFIAANVGTSEFGGLPSQVGTISVPPAFAVYVNGPEIWAAEAGILTSQVTATSETCAVTPPPFAMSATCHIATFDETGQITLELVDFELGNPPGVAPIGQMTELIIPRQTIRGIVQTVTEISPVTLPAHSAVRAF